MGPAHLGHYEVRVIAGWSHETSWAWEDKTVPNAAIGASTGIGDGGAETTFSSKLPLEHGPGKEMLQCPSSELEFVARPL